MRPYDPLPESVTWHDDEYRIDYSYTAVLAALDVLIDERMLPALRLRTALDILIIGNGYPEDTDLLRTILSNAGFDSGAKAQASGPRCMDIKQDWPLIVAAFLQTYGIDLFENKTMHIMEFQVLLQGLPKNTRMMEIASIRAAEIPAPNKHNAKQIQELTRLKAKYAIRGNETDIQHGLENMFNLLSERAKK